MCEQDVNDPTFKKEFLEEICIQQETKPDFPSEDPAEEFYGEIETFLMGLRKGRKRKKF